MLRASEAMNLQEKATTASKYVSLWQVREHLFMKYPGPTYISYNTTLTHLRLRDPWGRGCRKIVSQKARKSSVRRQGSHMHEIATTWLPKQDQYKANWHANMDDAKSHKAYF